MAPDGILNEGHNPKSGQGLYGLFSAYSKPHSFHSHHSFKILTSSLIYVRINSKFYPEMHVTKFYNF